MKSDMITEINVPLCTIILCYIQSDNFMIGTQAECVNRPTSLQYNLGFAVLRNIIAERSPVKKCISMKKQTVI